MLAENSQAQPPQKRRYGDSCEACRRRKRKCDAHEAPCAQCLKSGTECVFPASAAPARLARTMNELDYHKDFIGKLLAATDESRAEMLGDWSRKHTTSATPSTSTSTIDRRKRRTNSGDNIREEPTSPKKFKVRLYNIADIFSPIC